MSAFGAEVDEVWPAVSGDSQPLTEFGMKLLQKCQKVKKPKADIDGLCAMVMQKSKEFPLPVGYNPISD